MQRVNINRRDSTANINSNRRGTTTRNIIYIFRHGTTAINIFRCGISAIYNFRSDTTASIY